MAVRLYPMPRVWGSGVEMQEAALGTPATTSISTPIRANYSL
jgi:hypothetical protein